MIGRADIDGAKINVAVDAWLPRASYPCGNFSDTSSYAIHRTLRIVKPAFLPHHRYPGDGEGGFCLYARHGVSVPTEPPFGQLRYVLTDVPPQPNSPSNRVLRWRVHRPHLGSIPPAQSPWAGGRAGKGSRACGGVLGGAIPGTGPADLVQPPLPPDPNPLRG